MQRNIPPIEEITLDEPPREHTLSDEMLQLDVQNNQWQQDYQRALLSIAASRAEIIKLTKQKAESLEAFALYDQQIKKLEIEIDNESQLSTEKNSRRKLSAKLRDSLPKLKSEKPAEPLIETVNDIAEKLRIHRDKHKQEFDEAVYALSEHQLKINTLQAHAERQLIAIENNNNRKKMIITFLDAIKSSINELAQDINNLSSRMHDIALMFKQTEMKQKRHIAFIASGWFKADETATQYLIDLRASLIDKIEPLFRDINTAFKKKAELMKAALTCVSEDDIEKTFQLHSLGAKLSTTATELTTLNISVRTNRAVRENILLNLSAKKREQLHRQNETIKHNRHAITYSYLGMLRQHDEHLEENPPSCFARLFSNKQKQLTYIEELRDALAAYDVSDTATLYTSKDKQAIARLRKVVNIGVKRYQPGFFSLGYSKTSHPAKNLHHILKLLDRQLSRLHEV